MPFATTRSTVPLPVLRSLATALILSIGGCTQMAGASRELTGTDSIDRAPDLKVGLTVAPISDSPTKAQRNAYVEALMTHSDDLCAAYKDRIISLSRDQRLTTDIAHTALSGAAALVGSLTTANILAGAGTTIAGLGGAFSTDTFAQQTGEILASAIQTARDNQANQIEINLKQSVDDYPTGRAIRDVNTYHHMCGLETAFSSIRSSLKTASPDAGTTPQAAQGQQTNTGQAAATFVPPPPTTTPPVTMVLKPAPVTVRSVVATPAIRKARTNIRAAIRKIAPSQQATIFNQCIDSVGITPAPSTFTAFVQTANTAQLASVTQCLEKNTTGISN